MWRLPTGVGTALALVAGLRGAECFETWVWYVIGASGGVLALLFRRSRTVVLPATVLLGCATGALRSSTPVSVPAFEEAWVAGRVAAWTPRGRGLHIVLEVARIDSLSFQPPRRMSVYGDSTWGTAPRAAWMSIVGRVASERGVTTPGAWAPRNLAGTVFPARGAVPRWGPGNPSPWFRRRANVVTRLRDRLPGFPGDLAEAMILGRSHALSVEERNLFRRTGVSHLVAVSGLHVGLLAMLAALVLSPAPRTVRLGGSTTAAVLYAALAGWAPSALRSAALVGGFALGSVLRRPRSTERWLSLALPWLLWAQPDLVYSVSFLLSVGAVGGILFALELTGKAPRTLSWLSVPAVVSLGAQWGTLPTIVATFGALSPLALLPNLTAVPLAGLFLPAVFLTLAFSITGAGSDVFAIAALGLAAAMERLLRGAALLIPFWDGLPRPQPAVTLMFPLLLLIWYTSPRRWRARARVRLSGGLAALLAALLCFLPFPVPPGPWVAFLDVGQGDASVLRLSDGTTWVVDVGDDRGPGDAARNALLPFLRDRGIRTVDGLILSHRHRDHAGALAAFLDGVKVGSVYDAGYGRGATARMVDSVLAVHRLWPCLVAAGDTLHRSPELSLVAVHPPGGDPLQPPPEGNLNEASLMVRVVDRDLEVLYAGDGERLAEAACISGGRILAAEVLKVGHHGSATSSSPPFLRAVKPRLAVISCGTANRFGHPAKATLRNLRDLGVEVVRTDLSGSVIVDFHTGKPVVIVHPPRTVTPGGAER